MWTKEFRPVPVQVSDIDIQKESPCGHGVVICFSVYCGREAHFGELVDGQPADGILQNQLWVDTLVDEHKDQVLHKSPNWHLGSEVTVLSSRGTSLSESKSAWWVAPAVHAGTPCLSSFDGKDSWVSYRRPEELVHVYALQHSVRRPFDT